MTAVMSIYLIKLAFRKLGVKGALMVLALPIALVSLLISFII